MASLLNILQEEVQERQEAMGEQEIDDIELDFEDFGVSSSNVDNALFNFGSATNVKAGQKVISKDTKKEKTLQDDFDDDFDYDNDEPAEQASNHKVSSQIKGNSDQVKEDPKILQEQLKKFAVSKDNVRKKNYIGDAVIAERSEQEETEIAA